MKRRTGAQDARPKLGTGSSTLFLHPLLPRLTPQSGRQAPEAPSKRTEGRWSGSQGTRDASWGVSSGDSIMTWVPEPLASPAAMGPRHAF